MAMDGIALMASAMRAQQARLTAAAGNLANVSSDGFRKVVARVRFGARGLETATHVDPSPAPLRRTGRALDLAVAGAGTFAVREANGNVAAARSGSFVRGPGGALVDERGEVLLGDRGTIRAGEAVSIDERGFVRDGDASAGRVRLSPGASLASGFLQASNVDSVGEMIGVLDAQRAFETAQKALVALDEARNKDANDVARVRS